MKKLKHILLLTFALALASSCVYDFNPDIQGKGGYLVVEGNILIGDYTRVKLSRSVPLSGEAVEQHVSASCYVEASDGTRYGNGSTSIDTRFADPSLEYRLVITCGSGTYVSRWEPVVRAAEIDSIAYTISDDRTKMTIDISSHGGDESRYYRWTATESWEYHAPFHASHYFVPRGTLLNGEPAERDTVAMYENGENSYYCWNSGAVKDVMITSSGQLSENRLIRHKLYSMDCYEQRVSYLYSVLVVQEALTETAFRYWTMLQKNSTDVGGLFSPEPYEMRGNIVNQDNPDEMVLGYISASVPSVMRYFIRTHAINFPRTRRSDYDYEPVYVQKNKWAQYYFNRDHDVYMIHVTEEPGSGRENEEDYEFDWLPKRCVKCWLWGGGTKQKPDYWPNDHK